MSDSPIEQGMAGANGLLQVVYNLKRWGTRVLVALAILGTTVYLAWGASTTIPERAQALCGFDDCSKFVQHIRGPRRRLTISVDDGGITFGTLTHRLYTDAGVGQICANCSLPTEAEAADIQFMVNALLWQTSTNSWQGELRAICGDKVPVIYKVYPKTVVIVDHSMETGATVFQCDVRVGCI